MKQMQLQNRVEQCEIGPLVAESKRVPLERKVVLKFHHFGGFFIEYSANISLTGMFIKTDQPKPPGSVFIFEIWLGDEYRLVHGLGEVVWTRTLDEGSDRPTGMGIRYLKIGAESRAVIERVITEHLQKGGDVFDLGLAAPLGEVTIEQRGELRPIEAIPEPSFGDELLQLDEDLLNMDLATDDFSMPPHVTVAGRRSASRLHLALLLVVLAALMGGAAYLVGADLLPF